MGGKHPRTDDYPQLLHCDRIEKMKEWQSIASQDTWVTYWLADLSVMCLLAKGIWLDAGVYWPDLNEAQFQFFMCFLKGVL